MFTFNERLGIFTIIEGACLSVVAVTSILGFVIYKWLRRTALTWRRSDIISSDASDSSLFLNLMLADLVQAIGNIPSIVWMESGEIEEGSLCTAQAAIKQVGIVGVAMTSLAISVHTFAVLVLRWQAPRRASKLIVVAIWTFVGLVIGIPNAIQRHRVYYGPTGYWCWIVHDFKTEQIVTEYLWVWVAGFVMILLYGIMFLVMRGWFIIDDGIHWHKNYAPSSSVKEIETEEEKTSKAIANLLLFYPAVYILCVFPNSLARWLTFSGSHIPYQFTLFANTIFSLSGLLNVILFFSTRPDMVKGPKVIIESEEIPLHQRKDSAASYVPHKLGRLPERNHEYNTSVEGGERWPPAPRSEFDASTLHNHSSPAMTFSTGPLGPTTHAKPASYRSHEYHPSAESSALNPLIDEEDYGHLPG